MMLDLDNGAGGEYIRFKPSVNEWVIDGEAFDLKAMSINPASLKTGWGKIQEGEAPDWRWDEQVGVKGPRPDDDFKRGFSVMVHIKDVGWREWSANGTGANMGLRNIWPSIHEGMADNQGKVAGLKYTGSKSETVGKGSTRVPNFEFVKWLPFPQGDEAVASTTPPAPEPNPTADDDEALFA